MSDPLSDFSGSQRIGFVMGSALTQFTTDLKDLRRLLELAVREDTSRKRPAELDAEADRIGKDRARLVERAAIQAFDAYSGRIKEIEAESLRGEEEADARHHPLAPEQVIAMLVMLSGREHLEETARSYMEACGGDSAAAAYGFAYLQWARATPLSTKMATSLVPMAVAQFGNLVGALYRQWLIMYPDALGEKKLNYLDAYVYASGDDILRKGIDEKVADMLAGGSEGWVKQVSDDLKIDMPGLAPDWDAVVEVFARRNAIVHAAARVDPKYLKRTGREDIEAGTTLECDKTYATSTFDHLEELGIALSVTWFAKLDGEGPEPAVIAAPHILRALERADWTEAQALSAAVVDGRDPECLPPEVRVNWWMARREAGEGVEGIRNEVEAWDPPGDDPEYRLAKAALLLDANVFKKVLSTDYQGGGAGVPPGVRAWPLVSVMRRRFPDLQPLFAIRPAAPNRPKSPPRPRRRKGGR
ncbi:MAG: hypothetical protein ACYCU7_00390 [Acidimicrobiales bacterium]